MSDDVAAQNLEAEESILGAMMLNSKAVAACAEEVDAEDFYRRTHGAIFAAILEMDARGTPVDPITVADYLHERGLLDDVGGRVRIHELAALVPATANAGHYARIVRELAVLRRMGRMGHEAIRLARERPGELPELIELMEAAVSAVTGARSRQEGAMVGDVLGAAYQRLVELQEGATPGLPSGFRDLDRILAGLQPGNLVVVAGRPAMGKTGFALGIIENVAVRLSLPVCLFTLEMSRIEVTQRLMAMGALVDSHRMRTGNLDVRDWQDLTAACTRLEKAPLTIEDSAVTTLAEIRAKARRAKARHPALALVVVDYLQLMGSLSAGGGESNRVQEVSAISRGLKVLAGELGVPVVALSQLSRAVEQRHDKRPILSDLRESGSIEQDADVVLMLYRDEYYSPEESDQQGIAEVNVAKQRNGPNGVVKLAFVKRNARFTDLAPS